MEPVIMPVLDMTMEQGKIVRWHKRPGESVRVGDLLFEVETDKATIEVEAQTEGILVQILYSEGTVVPVREVIAYIAQPGETAVPNPMLPVEGKLQERTQSALTTSEEALMNSMASYTALVRQSQGQVRATPAARRLARQLGIELSDVKGSGRGGAIHRKDVEKYLEVRKTTDDVQSTQGAEGLPTLIVAPSAADKLHAEQSASSEEEVERFHVAGNRKAVAGRMEESARIPQVTLWARANVAKLLELRRHLGNEVEKRTGHSLTLTSLLSFLVARTLIRHPYINAHWRGEEIWRFRTVHLGIATALPNGGLVVPVLRHAEKLSLSELSLVYTELMRRAREGKLRYEEFTGATFTISNLGMYGVEAFNAMLYPPQVGILSIGKVIENRVQGGSALEIISTVQLGLTFDHRALDGAEAGLVLQDLIKTFEDPWQVFL